ncbi:hypothetical protein [Bacteroides nordii]|nr:hypothetical protein [Bacteroides nordii]
MRKLTGKRGWKRTGDGKGALVTFAPDIVRQEKKDGNNIGKMKN